MKINRQAVLEKYDNHCAYCGNVITVDKMEVDHIWPKNRGGTDDIENLNPACHTCNWYKSTLTLDQLREEIKDKILPRLRKQFIFRLSENYGMIQWNEWDGKFYFERID
jgi:5-methylcytosine-specific restriction endonuclease McrA